MKKPHLFFIKIKTSFNVYYYSMKYELEEVQTTTNNNIITIMKDVLKRDAWFYDDTKKEMEFIITEVKLEDRKEYRVSDIQRYISHFIYYDGKIKDWVVTYKNEPDYKIFNCIMEDMSVKIMLVGSYFDSVIKDEHERERMFDLFENYYHTRPSDAIMYKIQDETYESSIRSIYDCLPKDVNKKYAIILQNGYNLSTIKKFTELCYNTDNIEIFVLSDLDYYRVYVSSAEIKFKKVCMR